MTYGVFTDDDRRRARELETWQYEWAGEQIDAGVNPATPPDRPTPSDFNQHGPEMLAPAAALDEFFDRANRIMDVAEPPVLTAAADVATGAMVAFVPSAADCERLAVGGGEPVEQLHMTAAYLGEAADWDDANRAQLLAAVSDLADQIPPWPAQGFAVSLMNPDGSDPAAVLGIGGPETADAQGMAATTLAAFAHLMPEQHRPHVSHVTLAYQHHRDFARQMPGYVQRCGPVNFDRLRVAFAGEVIDFALTGATMTAADAPGGDMQPDPTVIVQPIPLDVVPAATDGTPFYGVCAVEGQWTGDRRMFAPDSLDLGAPLPWALKWQPAEDEGHEGSVIVGRIDTAVRDGALIRISGVMDDGPEGGRDGCEAARLMERGMLRGNSVMTDDTSDVDIEMIYPEPQVILEAPISVPAGVPLPPGAEVEPMYEPMPEMIQPGEPAVIIHHARIRSVTLLPEPAFVEAVITLGIDPQAGSADMLVPIGDAEPIVASGHTITIPNVPPAEWFDEPTDVLLAGAWTVTDEGRVYGLLAPDNVAHRSFRDRRVTVPMGNVDYDRYLGREVIVAGGGRRVCGVVTMNCGHCPPSASNDPAIRMEHYDNSCSVVASINVIEKPGVGVIVAGALSPGVTAEQVVQMMGCQLSGDWAPHPEKAGRREFVAALLVPVPGYPMPRTAASVTASTEPAPAQPAAGASVRFNDQGLVAAAIPAVFADGSIVASGPQRDYSAAMERLARSIGRDKASRFAELRQRVHGGGDQT